jgi:hypothetical protein
MPSQPKRKKRGWTIFTPPVLIATALFGDAGDEAAFVAAKKFQQLWKKNLTNKYPEADAIFYGRRSDLQPEQRISRIHRFLTSKRHAASAPGEKPALETGALRLSIKFREIVRESQSGTESSTVFQVFTFDRVAKFLEFGTRFLGGAREHLIPTIRDYLTDSPHPEVQVAARQGIAKINLQPIRRRLQRGVAVLGHLQATGIPLPKAVGFSRVWALKFSRGLGDLDAFGSSVVDGTDQLPRRFGRRLAGRKMGLLMQQMIPPSGGGNIGRFGKRILRTRVGRGTGSILNRI